MEQCAVDRCSWRRFWPTASIASSAIPDTTESPLLDSLLDYPQLQYIVHLHEGVAVGAANFYGQASGKTAFVNLHVAPGLGNAIGMIYGALKNNTPMVVTAGQQDTASRLRDPVLGHDLAAIAAPVTKWSVQVERADEMGPVLQRAFKIANEAPAGPVFVALPINVMEQETDVPPGKPGTALCGEPPRSRRHRGHGEADRRQEPGHRGGRRGRARRCRQDPGEAGRAHRRLGVVRGPARAQWVSDRSSCVARHARLRCRRHRQAVRRQ